MKVVILAGGRGTRLIEETADRPKPMVDIGGKPILWHIMRIYANCGFNEFLVACGYRGEVIQEYFCTLTRDLQTDVLSGSVQVSEPLGFDARVEAVDTGLDTQTGGRILRLREHLTTETFMVTYGDGLADVDVGALLKFHRGHGKHATVTAVHPPPRFGALDLDGDAVRKLSRESGKSQGWINGGFFVFNPAVLDYLDDDQTVLEQSPAERLAADGQLMAYRHTGFWQSMDTLAEKQLLESIWAGGDPPWKTWA